ncbi:MAG TPA: glycoside hydrolase family 31 protein [Polyangium sp.]|nr:glycoside hydrolase family 31 protein [Polyangium sp.]
MVSNDELDILVRVREGCPNRTVGKDWGIMMQARRFSIGILLTALSPCACTEPAPRPPPVKVQGPESGVEVQFEPFELGILDGNGNRVLVTATGEDVYGGAAGAQDEPSFAAKSLPGWDGYQENIVNGWRHPSSATIAETRADGLKIQLNDGSGLKSITLDVTLNGPRVRLFMTAVDYTVVPRNNVLNKSSLAFVMREDEHFYGLGERFASVDHRGLSLYSYAEEGGLGQGESTPDEHVAPLPNGPSMTYFPVPFFLSNAGYGLFLDTTYRTELHFGSEASNKWRAAVNSNEFSATIYVHHDPLATIADYTEDTGRARVPAPWVFGPRRRVGRGDMVDGVPEYLKMRERKIPVTSVDDAMHFLPALSHLGIEAELMTWTANLHAAGYKAMAYNNPYVAENNANATMDYEFGKMNGYFVKKPDGQPALTEFISGKLLRVAAIDLTNPDAEKWFQDLLRRTLDIGYDGWMHDFGEYIPRDAVLFDGRRGDEFHNAFPVLSAKAAHDLLEAERPNDYLFFVRSGGSGTQKYVPAVWGGDAEATFDNSQGLPSSVHGGLNLSMSGVPYWGSDMTGFKCLTSDPNDKEVFLRWVEFGAVSPIMMEQNACKNPIAMKEKWKLFNDEETIQHYRKYAGLHTRLLPYFQVLANRASETGRPLTLHPFLTHPDEPDAWAIEDAFFLGAALYVSPIVGRGQTSKDMWLPPGKSYVHFDDFSVHDGGMKSTIAAPLGKMPLFLVSGEMLPLLDPSIDTLAPATDPTVVTLDMVKDRLDVMVALAPGEQATLVLADGTELVAKREMANAGNPGGLAQVTAAEIADCARCYVTGTQGQVDRLRVNSDVVDAFDMTIEDVHVTASKGPGRRLRWDVLRIDGT